jgi:hypothetical protein
MWEAGFAINPTTPDSIGIYLASWTDTKIVINGFGTLLGTNHQSQLNVAVGDTLTIIVIKPNCGAATQSFPPFPASCISAFQAVVQASVPDRIFGATSYSGAVLKVYDITNGTPVYFATLDAGGWIGPLGVRGDGHVFAVTNANQGSLWDITAGGDFTSATPLASKIFGATLTFPEGMAFDAQGNAYITNSEAGLQPIAKVTPTGTVSYLPGTFNNARGLVIKAGILYIAEGGTGRVLAFNLSTNSSTVFATGFVAAGSHVPASLAMDSHGRILTLWFTAASNGQRGLYDITKGGNFSAAAPLVSSTFGIDVNQMGVDSANNVYVAGDASGSAYISVFSNGEYQPFKVFAAGLGDTESIAVLSR